MPEIELKPTEYRVRGVTRAPKVRLTFFEALSFAIGSTWATRKKAPADPEKSAAFQRAIGLGLVWYFTHRGL